VLAAPGYPVRAVTGGLITGLDIARGQHPDVQVFHAGTERGNNGSWLTAGGRVLGLTATARTLDQALEKCYAAAKKITWDGIQYRRDIGRFKR
jgi:phosphoribosylamine--glycine ligase